MWLPNVCYTNLLSNRTTMVQGGTIKYEFLAEQWNAINEFCQ